MRKFLLLFLFCAINIDCKVVAHGNDIESAELLDDDVLQQLEELPEEMLQVRELPWYINVISGPGVYIFLKACSMYDWFRRKTIRSYKMGSYLLYSLCRRYRVL